MRDLSFEEMRSVGGGGSDGSVRLGTISISSDRASGGGGRTSSGGGHSVSNKNYPPKDSITGLPVRPGGQNGKTNRHVSEWELSGVGVEVGTSGASVSGNWSKRPRGAEPR